MNWLRVKNNAELRLDPNAEEKYYQGKHRIVGKITKGQQAVQDYKELQGDELATGLSVPSIIYMDTGLLVTCRKTFKLKHCGGISVLVR